MSCEAGSKTAHFRACSSTRGSTVRAWWPKAAPAEIPYETCQRAFMSSPLSTSVRKLFLSSYAYTAMVSFSVLTYSDPYTAFTNTRSPLDSALLFHRKALDGMSRVRSSRAPRGPSRAPNHQPYRRSVRRRKPLTPVQCARFAARANAPTVVCISRAVAGPRIRPGRAYDNKKHTYSRGVSLPWTLSN